MSFLRKHCVALCIAAAVALFLLSIAAYLFADTEFRTVTALASCVMALTGIINGFLTFDDKS